jgi:hypothetical protein
MNIKASGPGRLAFLCLTFGLALGGCKSDLKMSEVRGTVPSRDLQLCASSSGRIESRGKAGIPTCVHSYSDAGKACSGKSDCKGRCLANEGPGGLPRLGNATGGHCQADDKLFGCYAEVQGGKAKAAICVD